MTGGWPLSDQFQHFGEPFNVAWPAWLCCPYLAVVFGQQRAEIKALQCSTWSHLQQHICLQGWLNFETAAYLPCGFRWCFGEAAGVLNHLLQ